MPHVIPIRHFGKTAQAPATTPRRNVAWLLRHVAVGAVLALVAIHLLGVVYLTNAQRELKQAAVKTANSASTSGATARGIAKFARQELLAAGFLPSAIQLQITIADKPANRKSRIHPGETIGVTLRTPARTAIAPWIARLAPWLTDEELIVATIASAD